MEKETWRIWKKKEMAERSMCVYIEEGEQKDEAQCDTRGTCRSVQTRLRIKRGNFIFIYFLGKSKSIFFHLNYKFFSVQI